MKFIPYIFIALGLCSCLSRETLEPQKEVVLEGAKVWNSIHFFDEMRGIAVGGQEWYEGHMAYTLDGGDHWAFRQMGNKELQSIAANDRMWVAVGIDGYIFYGNPNKLSDSAQFVRQEFWEYLNDVALVDSDNIAISVGGIGLNKGFVQQIMSVDWSTPNHDTFNHVLEAVTMAPDGSLIAVGYAKLLSSQDKGASWSPDFFRGAHLMDVLFTSDGTGFLCSRNGKLWQKLSMDSNWESIDLPFSSRALYFNEMAARDNEIWVCGDRGTLIYSTNSGDSWTRLVMDEDEDFLGISLTEHKVWLATRSGKLIALER